MPQKPYDPNRDEALIRQVEDGLDSIRPYLLSDGGDVRLHNITSDMVVELELMGACAWCPISTMTLHAGIEQALRHAAPRIRQVVAINVR